MATTLVITEENKLAAVRAVAKLMDAAIEIPGPGFTSTNPWTNFSF